MITEPMHESFTISVVDDDPSVREALGSLLRSVGYRVASFRSAAELLAADTLASSTCLVLDVNMPGMTGPELQDALAARGCSVPIIFMTGRADDDIRARVLAKGAVDLLEKSPDDQERLLDVIDALIRR